MKTDREIAEEAFDWWSHTNDAGLIDVAVKAIELARLYGALDAPKPAVDWEKVRIDAAIAAMRSYVDMTGYNGPEVIAKRCAERAWYLVAELKKREGEE